MHPTLIHGWKKLLLAGADALFANGSKPAAGDAEGQKAELFEQIGRLKIELEWVKKNYAGKLGASGASFTWNSPVLTRERRDSAQKRGAFQVLAPSLPTEKKSRPGRLSCCGL